LTVTILFGIEAPLCAMACLDTVDVSLSESHVLADANPATRESAVQRVVASDASPTSPSSPSSRSTGMPCHESGDGPAPAESGNAHDDCGCAWTVAGLISDSPAPLLNSSPEFRTFGTSSHLHLPLLPRDREAAVAAFESELPPPDILLLKSTLLI
jgi:hypothetical protein